MFSVEPLKENFGAQVKGIDMVSDCNPETLAEITRLWGKHQLLLFKNQSLEEEELVAFSRGLGDLEIHIRTECLSSTNPEILYISNAQENGRDIGLLSSTEVGWHYDQIYRPKPAVGSLLYAVTVPASGGATSFADMAAAYDGLPANVRDNIDGLRAVHSYHAFNEVFSTPTSKKQTDLTPPIDHPLVRTHPLTGRKALYVSPTMTIQIIDMADGEAKELLDYLFEWSLRPEFIYTHEWEVGDALLWSNASTMHRREPFNESEIRLMKRTTILPPEEMAVPV